MNVARLNTPPLSSGVPSYSPAPQAQPADIQPELQKATEILKGGLSDEEEYKQHKGKIISET